MVPGTNPPVLVVYGVVGVVWATVVAGLVVVDVVDEPEALSCVVVPEGSVLLGDVATVAPLLLIIVKFTEEMPPLPVLEAKVIEAICPPPEKAVLLITVILMRPGVEWFSANSAPEPKPPLVTVGLPSCFVSYTLLLKDSDKSSHLVTVGDYEFF